MLQRILLLTLDAIVTAPVRPRQAVLDHLRVILRPRSRKFDKVPSAVNLIDSIVPGVAKLISKRLCRSAWLPLQFETFKLMNYGSGASVFLAGCNGRKYVLKIYRRSLGSRLEDLVKISEEFKDDHRLVSSWYSNDEFCLVPPADFMVLNGPLFGSPVAASLQPFIEGTLRDPFLDYQDAELISLMKVDEQLLRQFMLFAEKTVRHFSEGKRCFDLIGHNNLAVAHNGDNFRLVVLDTGVFPLRALRKEFPKRHSLLEERIAQLQTILTKLGP